jgi:hypothetical protein
LKQAFATASAFAHFSEFCACAGAVGYQSFPSRDLSVGLNFLPASRAIAPDKNDSTSWIIFAPKKNSFREAHFHARFRFCLARLRYGSRIEQNNNLKGNY